jgi:hypothetical protein
MDDFGSLIWRFGRLMIVHSPDADHDAEDRHGGPPTGTAAAGTASVPKGIVHPAAE